MKEANSICEDGRSKFAFVLDRCFKVSDCLIDNYVAAPKNQMEEQQPSTSEDGNSNDGMIALTFMTDRVDDHDRLFELHDFA